LGVGIVTGRYHTGDVLNNEIEASEKLKVSRSAYREAIRILDAKGMVNSRPKVGTRVSAPESWHLLDPDVLTWIFESDPNEELLANLFELRTIVEPEAAALAATRRTRAHLDSMQRGLQGMAEHSLTTEAGQLADREFHSTLLRASGNAFLASLTSGISAAITWTTIFKQRKNRLSRDPMPDHQRVYDAIEAADAPAARKAMRVLVDMAFVETTNPRSGKRRTR
jgi:DNA-binding FadR family transcriptional regulator